MSYKILKGNDNQEVNESIIHLVGAVAWTIPPDPGNTDYQKYLLWVAEGNTAEVIDL